MIRTVKSGLALSLLGLAASATASGATAAWGTSYLGNSSSPQASAYGTVWTYGGNSRLYNSSYQRDHRANGVGVTVKTEYYWTSPTAYAGGVEYQTPTTSNNAYTFGRTDSGGVAPASLYGVGRYRLCENYNLSPDNCTYKSIRTVSNR